MRHFLIVLLLFGSVILFAQSTTYYGKNGKVAGRAVTRGNTTTYYDPPEEILEDLSLLEEERLITIQAGKSPVARPLPGIRRRIMARRERLSVAKFRTPMEKPLTGAAAM